MPRFVILKHTPGPASKNPLHWDLMLEAEGVLRTWALDELPRGKAGSVEARRLADHRLEYLDYEGPVSGDRGSVSRVAAGDYETQEEQSNLLRFKLVSDMLTAVFILRSEPDDALRWRLEWSAGTSAFPG